MKVAAAAMSLNRICSAFKQVLEKALTCKDTPEVLAPKAVRSCQIWWMEMGRRVNGIH